MGNKDKLLIKIYFTSREDENTVEENIVNENTVDENTVDKNTVLYLMFPAQLNYSGTSLLYLLYLVSFFF